MADDLLTSAQLRERFGLTSKMLHTARQTGRLTSAGIQGARGHLYRLDDVRRYVAERPRRAER